MAGSLKGALHVQPSGHQGPTGAPTQTNSVVVSSPHQQRFGPRYDIIMFVQRKFTKTLGKRCMKHINAKVKTVTYKNLLRFVRTVFWSSKCTLWSMLTYALGELSSMHPCADNLNN